MNYSDQLRLIASVLLPTHPACAAQLDHLATGVRRLERTFDEIAADAMEDELLVQAATNVVRLDRFRTIPISGGAA